MMPIEWSGERLTLINRKTRPMVTFEHQQLMRRILSLDEQPEGEEDSSLWRTGDRHVEMLRANARETELIVAAIAPATFVHMALVPADHPGLDDHEGLLNWSCSLFHHSAAKLDPVVSRDEVRFEPRTDQWGTPALAGGEPMIYGRTLEGANDESGTYYEVPQPFTHHVGIHWRPERNAYCRFDRRGDWEDVVSITKSNRPKSVTLATFQRDALDQYLVEHNQVLVRLFNFHYCRTPARINWQNSSFVLHEMDREVVFRQQFSGDGSTSAARGVQIIRPMLTKKEVEGRIKSWGLDDQDENPPVEFTVLDFRNRRVAVVSTDPETTTNYFKAQSNSLPFETSPAAFRPEVLLKYKADTEKYTVREGWLDCRASWSLKSYSINDAGQVMVYICDLRHLPHEELLHWKSFNEEPKTGLSERAITTDFKGEWPKDMTPREMLVDVLQRWAGRELEWWKWRPAESPEVRVVVPRTSSRDEWQRALGQLSNDVTEGFSDKALRRILEGHENDVDKNMRSIALLERILRANGELEGDQKLVALRELNHARNLGPAHAGQSDANDFVNEVLQEHETFAAHFGYLCEMLAGELTLIEDTLAKQSED